MDLAKEILEYIKLQDRPSRFELTANGQIYETGGNGQTARTTEALKITSPVEDGKLIWKVRFFDNCAMPQSSMKWETLCYSAENWTGAASFVDGFMQQHCRRNNAWLYLRTFQEDPNGPGRPTKLAHWYLLDIKELDARIATVVGILKALLTT